jgi:hypothetical protein
VRVIFAVIEFSHNKVRNLYAIDYIKDHPDTTTAEFKAVFDNLDDATKKVFFFSLPSINSRVCPLEIQRALEGKDSEEENYSEVLSWRQHGIMGAMQIRPNYVHYYRYVHFHLMNSTLRKYFILTR